MEAALLSRRLSRLLSGPLDGDAFVQGQVKANLPVLNVIRTNLQYKQKTVAEITTLWPISLFSCWIAGIQHLGQMTRPVFRWPDAESLFEITEEVAVILIADRQADLRNFHGCRFKKLAGFLQP